MIQIDGRLVGDLCSYAVSVGEGGAVQGNICAALVIVRGRVTGNICSTTVELHSTSTIEGDIVHGSLKISLGARLRGHFRPFRAPSS